MKTAWEKLINYVEKNVAIEKYKYNDGYKNQYDEWLDVKMKLDLINEHQKELNEAYDMSRREIARRDKILIKHNLMHELI